VTAQHPRLEVVVGDITAQDVDAIVNAANSSLLGGLGVDGAVHRAGGPSILAACRALRSSRWPSGMPEGEAVATTAGNLPARWVIHTVGPVYSATEDRSAILASAYRRSLEVADEAGAASVAFPATSAGAYGWPMKDAARIAVAAVRATPTAVELVRFVVLREATAALFERALGSRSLGA
jgi:O-acetyl-ADP-ribose deacetylase (regulator of RNase III)